MKTTQYITLDVMDVACYRTCISAKQGDDVSRIVVASITDHGKPIELPSGVRATFRLEKPDGHSVITDAVIADNAVRVELTEQMLAVPGNVYADISFAGPGSEILSTVSFIILVAHAPAGLETPSESEWLVFQQAVSDAQAAAAKAEEAAGHVTPDPTLTLLNRPAESSAVGNRTAWDGKTGDPLALSRDKSGPIKNGQLTVFGRTMYHDENGERIALKDYVTPEMFGAKGDGTGDDSAAIMAAMSSNRPVIGLGTYKIDNPISFLKDRVTMLLNKIVYSGTGHALVMSSHECNLHFGIMQALNGSGFLLTAKSRWAQAPIQNTIFCNIIKAKNEGITLTNRDATEGGVAWNKFYGSIIDCDYPINIYPKIDGSNVLYINANEFNGFALLHYLTAYRVKSIPAGNPTRGDFCYGNNMYRCSLESERAVLSMDIDGCNGMDLNAELVEIRHPIKIRNIQGDINIRTNAIYYRFGSKDNWTKNVDIVVPYTNNGSRVELFGAIRDKDGNILSHHVRWTARGQINMDPDQLPTRILADPDVPSKCKMVGVNATDLCGYKFFLDNIPSSPSTWRNIRIPYLCAYNPGNNYPSEVTIAVEKSTKCYLYEEDGKNIFVVADGEPTSGVFTSIPIRPSGIGSNAKWMWTKR